MLHISKLYNSNQKILAVFIFSLSIIACQSSLPEQVKTMYSSLPDKVSYNNDIKPILSDRCYICHGPDKNARKAGLRLDIESEAFATLENGNRAFVKGSHSKSKALQRIISNDPEYKMPPIDSELSLSDREKALIAKWIDQGAQWEAHWSLNPVQKTEVPDGNTEWVQNNSIDHFIQRKLQIQGLQPTSEADKERLLKRVYMDLTGLPPAVENIEDFLNDKSQNAYEKVVNRLLASTDYAERMALEWMDVARYADSHGVSFDGYRNSWPYREWVIKAFHKNMPYDEFITHQVAGDLIENSDVDSKLATAFYRLNPLEASQGSIPEEFRVEYVNERTGLTGTAFLGLTVECAKCHDHKYDPISQKEFYQLSAFFNTTEEMGLGPTDRERAPTIFLYKDGEKEFLDSVDQVIHRLEEKISIKQNNYQDVKKFIQSLEELEKVEGEVAYFPFDQIKKTKKEKKQKKKNKKKEFKDIQILDNDKKAEATLNMSLSEGYKQKAAYFDGEYDYISLNEKGDWDHYEPFSVSTWILPKSSEPKTTQTIIGNSLFYFGDYRGWDFFINTKKQLTVRLIHRLPDDYLEVKTRDSILFDDWTHVGFSYDGSRKAKGVSIFINGQKVDLIVEKDLLTRSIASIDAFKWSRDTIPLRVGSSYRGWTMDKGLFKGSIDEVRLFKKNLTSFEMAHLAEIPISEISEAVKIEYLINKKFQSAVIFDSLKHFRKSRAEVVDSLDEIMIMAEMENPRKTFLLQRGLYNMHGEEVSPGAINQVLPYSETLPKNRLGLAMWLTDPNNPLVSRVAVNRYWKMIFGRGLVKTADDFGNQGERPSHPELLDYLASEFIENQWNVKELIRKMVLSYTYKQSSYGNEESVRLDPENIYLSRSQSYRWPAEFIRDNALMASGLLNKKIGGPSVKPYQPKGLWKELDDFSYKLGTYVQDSTTDSYRRTLYTFVRRFSPHPFLNTFDAPSREICEIGRDITNSPLQALILLNDPQIVEASRVLSERIQLEACDPLQNQIEYAFRLVTGLTPSKDQLSVLTSQYETSVNHFNNFPNQADSLIQIGLQPVSPHLDKVKTAALTMVTNTIFNYNDTYMKR